jgi:EAL and modified HD-GYP domain-containing signal transduction protein
LANGSMACYYRPGAAQELNQALGQAGWKPLLPRWRAPMPRCKDLDPAVQWVEGDWFLAPPAKAVGAQAASRALALQLVQLVSADADTHELKRRCARIRRCRITC